MTELTNHNHESLEAALTSGLAETMRRANDHANNKPEAFIDVHSPEEVAQYIDHTLLKPEATSENIQQLCEEALKNKFYGVCVNGANISLCKRLLRDSSVKTVAVVGFPLGAATTSSKAFEAKDAVEKGAKEIDMVLNVGQLKNKKYLSVLDDVRAVVTAVAPAPVKVILETSLLTDDEKVFACLIAKMAKAAFVKTSTGFSSKGATENDIKLMRLTVGKDMGVKASGGIKDFKIAKKMLAAGANRLGTSSGPAIISNLADAKGY